MVIRLYNLPLIALYQKNNGKIGLIRVIKSKNENFAIIYCQQNCLNIFFENNNSDYYFRIYYKTCFPKPFLKPFPKPFPKNIHKTIPKDISKDISPIMHKPFHNIFS